MPLRERTLDKATRHEWACFAAQQAAEKAVRALHLHLGQPLARPCPHAPCRAGAFWGRLGHSSRGVGATRAGQGRALMRPQLHQVEQMMSERPPGTSLEEALGVFEVFASRTLNDEVHVLDDVAGKRIAIAPAAFRDKFPRR
jgi:hypothetical protein